MLHSEESCPRELVVIPIPDGGYTVDYLKAIVHNAKLYIRPLQSDLSLEPLTAEVSVKSCSYITVCPLVSALFLYMRLPLQNVFQTPEEI